MDGARVFWMTSSSFLCSPRVSAPLPLSQQCSPLTSLYLCTHNHDDAITQPSPHLSPPQTISYAAAATADTTRWRPFIGICACPHNNINTRRQLYTTS